MLNSNDEEQWKPVVGYENIYWVSNQGRVKNARKVLKIHKNNRGYVYIDLTVDKQRKKFLVHRLVAAAFLCNSSNFPEVNHIDENKENNTVTNLEWCSRSFNKQHSIKTGTYHKIFTQKNTLGKKHKSTCLSKYHNITWDKNREKWQAGVRHNKKTWYQKRFDSEIDAALHVNWIIDTLGLTDRPKNIIT